MDTAELLSGRAPVPGDGLWQMPSNANLHFLLAEPIDGETQNGRRERKKAVLM